MGSCNHATGTPTQAVTGSAPMPPQGGSGSGAPRPPRLDIIPHSSTQSASRPYKQWSAQQCRVFHRAKSCLAVWSSHGYKALWITLTTANNGDASSLSKHHAELRRRFERRFNYPGMEYWHIKTVEGNGVIHAFWAWKPRNGYKQRPFICPNNWLSAEWKKIHGAYITKPRRLHLHGRSANGLSRYVVNQYVVNQETKAGECALAGMAWSWHKTFGFPVVRTWQHFKRSLIDRPKRELYLAWESFLAGNAVVLQGVSTTMAGLRLSPAPVAMSAAQQSAWWKAQYGPAASRWI